MQNQALFQPVCAQIMLTLLVWIWMYATRLTAIKKSGIDPQELADEARSDTILKGVVNPSDNFENLFELPVLFYIAMIVIAVMGLGDSTYVTLAWIFVGFRAFHSFVHCTYNKIMHRFAMYLFGSFALWAIWIRLTLQLCASS